MIRIELGDRAKDRITGFEGIVVAEMAWLFGCRRLTLQPEALKDGKPVDRQTFDEPEVERIAVSVQAVTKPADHPEGAILCGDLVQDRISGLKGIVQHRSVWIHGCTFIGVQPEGMQTKEKKPYESSVFDELRVKVIKRDKIKPAVARPERRTYGPRDDAKALTRSC